MGTIWLLWSVVTRVTLLLGVYLIALLGVSLIALVGASMIALLRVFIIALLSFFHSFAENLSFVGYDRSCRGQISW